MTSKRTRTLRGVITVGKQTLKNSGVPNYHPVRIMMNNGNLNQNYRVTSFRIFPSMNNTVSGYGFWNSVTNNNDNTYITLCVDKDGPLYRGNFGDNRQIGWAVAYSKSEATNVMYELDPNHIVVNDLWIGAYCVDTEDGSTDPTSVELNYMIEVEPIKSTDTQAVWQLLNENMQDHME